MFAGYILILAIMAAIGWLGYTLFIKPSCCCEVPPNGRSQEQKKLDELRANLVIVRAKVTALSQIEGAAEEMVELMHEIDEHELAIKEIEEEDLDE